MRGEAGGGRRRPNGVLRRFWGFMREKVDRRAVVLLGNFGCEGMPSRRSSKRSAIDIRFHSIPSTRSRCLRPRTSVNFLNNLAIDNAGVISTRYGEITSALNKKFRSTESRTANSLQVGSYGRKTAVRGVSDLDMLYLIPASAWKNYALGGQSSLLEAAKDAIQARYSTTKVTVDRMVVRVLYNNFHIEVQPVFEQEDGFLFPDTYNGGSWRLTKPREEKEATAKMDAEKNGNLRHLCKMVRAWKNKHGVAMGGLLIDTLAHRFLESTTVYDKASYASYGDMATVFFEYLADEPKKDRYTALGSGQHVKAKKSFKGKAKKALKLAQKASAEKKEASRQKKWRKVFGPPFPIDRVEIQKRADVLEVAGVSTPKSSLTSGSPTTSSMTSRYRARSLRKVTALFCS